MCVYMWYQIGNNKHTVQTYLLYILETYNKPDYSMLFSNNKSLVTSQGLQIISVNMRCHLSEFMDNKCLSSMVKPTRGFAKPRTDKIIFVISKIDAKNGDELKNNLSNS